MLAAGQGSSPQAAAALEELCRAYWYPLYAYVRRRGYAAHDAQDLTQAFFARLLERRTFAGIEREGGRFRSFLLTALSRFLRDEWEKLRAEKRGGGRSIVSFDEHDADERYRIEPVDELSADKLFERRWALAVLETALEKLRAECTRDGKAQLFESLAKFLTDDVPDGAYDGLGRQLGLAPGTVSVTLHRLRKRYRELVRAEVAGTVATPADVEGELRALMAALGGNR